MASHLLDQILDTSATLNGVFIPARQLETALARYTLNVFVGDDSKEFPVMLRGSGTAIRFNGNDLLLCTQHQLDGVDREKVGMMTEGGKLLITSAGMRHYDTSSDTDAFDLVAFDFTEPVLATPALSGRFLNLTGRWPLGGDIIAVLLIGYPFADQVYDLADNNHIGTSRRSVVCMTDPLAPSDNALVRVIPREPLDFDPDGMSGGTAFMVYLGKSGFEICFAGTVVRGGREGFYLIKPGLVFDFLKTVSSSWKVKRP